MSQKPTAHKPWETPNNTSNQMYIRIQKDEEERKQKEKENANKTKNSALDAVQKQTEQTTQQLQNTAEQTVEQKALSMKDLDWKDVTGKGYKEDEVKKAKARYERALKGGYKIDALERNLSLKRRGNGKITGKLEAFALKSAVYGIGGMPATFIENTDPPLPSTPNGLGYHYVNNVIRNGTFIAFQPGVIRWNISSADAKGIMENLDSGITHIARKFLVGEMDFNQPKISEYWREVSRHTRVAIMLMGIQDLGIQAAYFGAGGKSNPYAAKIQEGKPEIKDLSFKNFDQKDLARLGAGFANSVISGLPGISQGPLNDETDAGFVVFYVDGQIEASDTLTNQSEDSAFKTALDSAMGTTHDAIKEVIGKTIGRASGVKDVKDDILNFLAGNPIMPSVWSDSTFDKTYSFGIKLTSANGNQVSVFMNEIFPLIKICSLAVPLGTGGFYSSPPICRVYSQGVINTEYGLIETLTITRNMSTLNDFGTPTEIDVQMTVKDLNPHLFREMDGWLHSGALIGTSFTTFLATICGINVTTLTKSQKKAANELISAEMFNNEMSLDNWIFRMGQAWSDLLTGWGVEGFLGEFQSGLRLVQLRVGGLYTEGKRIRTSVGNEVMNTLTEANNNVNNAYGDWYNRVIDGMTNPSGKLSR